MARFAIRVPVVIACLVLGWGTVLAADQLIAGKRLLLKNPSSGAAGNKVVHLGKDIGITIGVAGGSGDPQCTGAGGGGGSLRIAASGGAGDVTIPLPCAGWTTNGTNTLYKYKDPMTTCTFVVVKNGVVAKAICKGSQVGIDLNGSMSPIAVVTTLNADRYCTEFGGAVVKDGSDDRTFVRKDAPPPPACASTTTSTTSTTIPNADDPVCCETDTATCIGTTYSFCVINNYVPTYNAVCDATAHCVPPPGTPGGCCQFGGFCFAPADQVYCENQEFATFHPMSVCQPYGYCAQ